MLILSSCVFVGLNVAVVGYRLCAERGRVRRTASRDSSIGLGLRTQPTINKGLSEYCINYENSSGIYRRAEGHWI